MEQKRGWVWGEVSCTSGGQEPSTVDLKAHLRMRLGWVRGESVTDNLSTVVARFPRPRLVVARARETSLHLSYPHGSQAVGFLLPQNKNPLAGTFRFVGAGGIEPSTVGLKGHCSTD